MLDARLRRGHRKFRRRQPIDAIVNLRIDALAGMRNGGKMDDVVHIRE